MKCDSCGRQNLAGTSFSCVAYDKVDLQTTSTGVAVTTRYQATNFETITALYCADCFEERKRRYRRNVLRIAVAVLSGAAIASAVAMIAFGDNADVRAITFAVGVAVVVVESFWVGMLLRDLRRRPADLLLDGLCYTKAKAAGHAFSMTVDEYEHFRRSGELPQLRYLL